MLVAKIIDRKGSEQFVEIHKQGPVHFDRGDHWVLIGKPLGVPFLKQDLQWVDPAEFMWVWIRTFNFKNREVDDGQTDSN